jgi:hypothetical protein
MKTLKLIIIIITGTDNDRMLAFDKRNAEQENIFNGI